MEKLKRVLVYVICLSLIVGNFNVYAQGLRMAEVVSYKGEVLLKKAGGEKDFEPYEGMELDEGTTIITGKNSELVLLIDGDKEVKVAEKSYVTIEELSVEDEKEKTGIRLFTGKIWSKIKNKLGFGDEYEIRTPNSIMGARGTKYVVSYEVEDDSEKSKSKLTVIEGVVHAEVEEFKVNDDKDSGFDTDENNPMAFDIEAGKETIIKPNEIQQQEVLIKEFTYDLLDLFTIDTVLEDIKNNPTEYKNSDELKAKLEEVRPLVEEKERANEKTDLLNEGIGVIYDNKPVVPVEKKKVSLRGLEISEESLNMKLGDSDIELSLRYIPSSTTEKKVVWSSTTSSAVTVDSKGVISAVGTGTATIRCDSAYGAYSASCNVTVQAVSSGAVKVSGVDIVESDIDMYKNESAFLNVNLVPSNASVQKVSWSSSDTSIATVDSTGKVTAVGKGNVVIKATSVDGGFESTCDVHVLEKPVTDINILQSTLGLNATEVKSLAYQLIPADAENKNVTWSSSNELIATVDGTGNVTGVSVGQTTIVITSEEGNYTDICAVNVSTTTVDVTGITLAESTKDLKVGEQVYLTPSFVPSNASNQGIIWTSSDASKVTVDSTGKITGISIGKADITVTSEDGGYTFTCEVNVDPISVSAVNIVESNIGFDVSDQQILSYQVLPGDATNQNVTWSSSDLTVATVDGNGEVTAVSPGNAIINLTSEDGNKTDSCSVVVVVNTINPDLVSIITTSMTVEKNDNLILSANVAPSNTTNKTVYWSSSNDTIASINSSGSILGKNIGLTTITATTQDGGLIDTLSVYVVETIDDTKLKKVVVNDLNNDGYIDQLIFDIDRDIIFYDFIFHIDKDIIFYDFMKPITQSILGTLDIDTNAITIADEKINVGIINSSYYGTGSIGDISLPRHLIVFEDYEASRAETVTLVDKASPIVRAMSETYNASENSSAFLRLKFSEAVEFDERDNKGAKVEVGEGTITAPPETSGDTYTLSLSGFVVGDQIEIRDKNKDLSDNKLIETIFQLTNDSGNLYWNKLQ